MREVVVIFCFLIFATASSPANTILRRNAVIQMAANVEATERADEAEKRLNDAVKEHPHDIEAIVALGNALREQSKFAECADVYSKAVAVIDTPNKSNWTIFYFRGICFERSKQWPKAEADLKKALELSPDEPHVLNYLGYSWIDQGINLDAGIAMIEKAVKQSPNDGYVVDSLGWADYKVGNYEEAVKNLERALELVPDDPDIHNHLGDAYWRVGRVFEAKFQWERVRDLHPGPEDLAKIEEKLKNGLR